jgi:dipeptidyl aminopeptidase/acylaminoacyl peptidase
MTLDTGDSPRLILLPARAGRPLTVPTTDLHAREGGFVSNHRLCFDGTGADGKTRVYVAGIDGSDLRLVTEDRIVNGSAVSPDGRFVALVRSDKRILLYPLEGGEPQQVQWADPDEVPIQWSDDGQFLFVRRDGELPVHVHRVNIETGERELWKTLMPDDATGVIGITNVVVTRNGLYYAYTCARTVSSELYVAEGIL